MVSDRVGDPNGLDGHPGGRYRLSVGDPDGGQDGRNAGRLQRLGDVHGDQLHAGAQRGEQGRLTPAFDVVTKVRPMTSAELQNLLRRLCRLDAEGSERG